MYRYWLSDTRSWSVNPQPIAPSLNTKIPNLSTICAGQGVSATFNSGSGGVGCNDDYIVSIDGGASTGYTPGNTVETNALNSIVIQGERAGCTNGAGCTGTGYITLASWTVNPKPIAPSLNTKFPNLSTICAGQGVSATFNSGSGGVGCNDDYIVSIDGAASTVYTPGNTVGTNALNSIVIQGERTGCTTYQDVQVQVIRHWQAGMSFLLR